MRTLAGLAGLAAAAALGATAAQAAAPQTTRPGTFYIVKVILADRAITISHARYARGAVIRYAIQNRGTRPYAFRIWGNDTAAIRPGGHDSILVNWDYRGRFLYESRFRGKSAGPKGYILVS